MRKHAILYNKMTRSIENNCTLQNSSLLPPSPPINNCYYTKGFMTHKALRYRLICSVDHVIGQAIFICLRVGGRVGRDTKRRLIGKNVELTIQNVWNNTLWQRSIGKIFCITTG